VTLLLVGIQRPLKDINVLTDSIYIPKGINIPSLDRKVKWEFIPSNEYRVGLLLFVVFMLTVFHLSTFFFQF